MTRASVAAPRLLALAALVACLAACGSDSLSGATPTSSSGGAPGTASAAVAATPGGTCTPAPAAANPATDSFGDAVCLVTTADGLRIGDITTGTGAVPQKGQNVTVQYSGWLTDGTLFDSSRKSGGSPFTFALGTGAVIPGWDEGLATMHVGGKRRLVIPPALGYGAAGSGSTIPPNATLVFEVEMLAAA